MESIGLMLCAILALGMAAQWLAWRFQFPSILLLLVFGFLLGRWVDPEVVIGTDLMFPVISLAVATILIEGGLNLKFGEIRETRKAVIRLCSLGVAVAWTLGAVAARYVLGLEWRLAALLGAILVVTGPTVIGPMLRQIRPVRAVGAIAKWEGIVVDPIGAVLAVLVFQAILAGRREEVVLSLVARLLTMIVVGVGGGYGLAKAIQALFQRHLIPDFLHSPVLLVAGLCLYAVANRFLPEVGLLAVTVLGITLGNQTSVPVGHILEFKENLRVLLISTLFIVLAARIDTEALRQVGPRALVFLVVLVLAVRPASVWLATLGSGLARAPRIFLSSLAPRGIVAAAVSTVFALEIYEAIDHGALSPELASQARQLVPVTFGVIIGTVAVYGLLAGWLARRLGLAVRDPQGIVFAGADPWVIESARVLRETGLEVLLVDTNPESVSQARMASVPALNANVLSRYVSDELELFGIGRLLAVTSNFEVNTLACQEFTNAFGRENVYQLRPDDARGQRTDLSHRLRGRPLFASSVTGGALRGWSETGARIKKTAITGKFTYADFQRQYGEKAVALFVLTGPGKVTILTDEIKELPPGVEIVSLVR